MESLDDPEVYKTFVAFFALGMVLDVGWLCMAIGFYVNLTRIAVEILIPRWNASALYVQFYRDLFWAVMIPIVIYFYICYGVAAAVAGILRRNASRKIRERSAFYLWYYQDTIKQAGLEEIQGLDVSEMNGNLKEVGLLDSTERAHLVNAVRERQLLRKVRSRKESMTASSSGPIERNKDVLRLADVSEADLLQVVECGFQAVNAVLDAAGVEPAGERLRVFLELKRKNGDLEKQKHARLAESEEKKPQ